MVGLSGSSPPYLLLSLGNPLSDLLNFLLSCHYFLDSFLIFFHPLFIFLLDFLLSLSLSLFGSDRVVFAIHLLFLLLDSVYKIRSLSPGLLFLFIILDVFIAYLDILKHILQLIARVFNCFVLIYAIGLNDVLFCLFLRLVLLGIVILLIINFMIYHKIREGFLENFATFRLSFITFIRNHELVMRTLILEFAF